jgi:probable FeS assembly SUF system protein SufT
MATNVAVQLTRDCQATLIPGGETVDLPKGAHVVLTQALGSSFTVMTDYGYLARIALEDADAIGQTAGTDTVNSTPTEAFSNDLVIEVLKTIFDPEIPVNVVDLGLIYGCESHLLADGQYQVEIQMSMTAPGCGMGDVLRQEAADRVKSLPGVAKVDIELVWDPPWDISRMSEAAKLQLGFY